jgi:hypothetical protein
MAKSADAFKGRQLAAEIFLWSVRCYRIRPFADFEAVR